MKKIKFLLAAAALMVGGSVWAQTDVTSTYLTNADFSDATGWTNYSGGGSEHSEGFGLIGTLNLNSRPSTTDATHLSTEYCVGFSARWNGRYTYYQQVAENLPAGAYTLTYDVQDVNSSSIKYSMDNHFYVKVGDVKYSDTSTEWMNAGASPWTTHTITFTLEDVSNITLSLGYGNKENKGSNDCPAIYVSHLKLTWTDPLQAAKDALQAEINTVTSEYATELATAIATAQDVLNNATTEEELTNAKTALHDDYLRYENGLADATYSAPVLTSFVVNGTFTDNVSGWTCTGGFQNQARASNQSGAFTVPFFENWNGSAKVNKMYQTINDIPNGTYRLDIAAFVNTLAAPNESQYVFANNDKTYLTTGDPTAYEVWTVVTTNSIEIGLDQTTATANWMGIDNVSLRYYGAGDVINDAQNASHKLAWEEAKAVAEAAIANTDYANVTGSEKTALQTEIDKAEPTTAQGYDDAAAALTSAKNAFTAAKTNYDIFATYNVTLDYADASKKPSVTSATAATILPALRAYYESNALAEGVDGAVNMTDRITDANNPQNNDGWTWTGDKNNPASNESWTDADGTNNHSYFDGGNWGASSWTTTMSQTITLPAGNYLLTAKARAAENTTFTMAVGEDNVALPHVGSTGNVFDRGWGDASLVFTTEGNGVTITVTASTNTVHEWFSISDFRLVQLEANNDIALHKQAWEEAKAAAEAARDNSDYDNVNGSERATLLAEIANKTEPATAEGYDDAAAALATATQAFVDAKPSYDAYANEKANADRISTTIASEIAAPTTADGCDAVIKSILVGEYNYVAANFNADAAATYGITIDQWTGTATSGGNSDTPQTNSNQKWGDAATTYYEQGRNGWGSNAWTLNYSKTVTLPASTYVLKVAARASEGVTASLSATIGENTITEALPNVGASGFGITTTGVASFDDNDTFANSDNGYGWQWRYLAFTLEDEGEVTLQINASAKSNQQWCSFGDVAVVSNVSTTDMETAYNNFTMQTLGFENGQYAPYNNVAVLEAYAEAAAIIAGTSVPSTQAEVDAITSTLTNPSWTANDGDVDAIYNGTFAETGTGNNPKGWTRSNNGWGQQITGLSAEANGVAEGTTTAWYYNTNGSWQYGNDGIYVMPLAANQAYELSFKYSKHGSDWQSWMKASVLNSDNEGLKEVEFVPAENGTTFVTAKAYFTTGAAGNYILSIEQNGNAHLTDVSLVKAASVTLALNETNTYETTDRTYYETVELTRKVVSGFNTVCLPFDLSAEQVADVFGNDAKVYEFEDIADGTKSIINFNTKDDNTIDANVPVLIGEATGSEGIKTINNVVLKNGEAKVEGTNFDFVGTYAPMTVAENDYFIGKGALYKSEGATNIKAFRAYIKAKSTEVKVLNFTIDGDDATGISTIENGQLTIDNAPIYNLAGQRIQKMQKGINIVNGKKIMK